MSRLGRAEVERLGHLARLRLEPEEAEALAADLGAILRYVAELEGVDTSRVGPAALGTPFATPLRADDPTPSLPPEVALGNAPAAAGTAFVVPPVLEGEEEG